MPDDIIPITRPISNNNDIQPVENKFPTEVINLPSKGWFYPIDHPLASGTLELKMITAKEEDILTSKNLIQKNLVLDKLLESVLVNKKINPEDMLICDRNAAFFAVRRLAYGDNYNASVTCGRCGHENAVAIDLSKMDNKAFDFDKYPKGENSFEYILPHSKNVLLFKLLTKKDDTAIQHELSAYQKVSKEVTKEVTTRLFYVITSVNGVTDKSKIRKFIMDEFRSIDSLAFRTHLRENMPDIDTSFDFHCEQCGLQKKEDVPMGTSFFWPDR